MGAIAVCRPALIALGVCLASCGEGLYTHVLQGPDASPVHDGVAGDENADRADAPGNTTDISGEPDGGVEERGDGPTTFDTSVTDAGPPRDVALGAPITSVTMEVGPGKAVLEIPDAATLTVPAGVLTTPTTMTLRAAKPGRSGAIGPAYEIEIPPNVTLHGNPRLEISFTPDPGVPPELVRLAYLHRDPPGGLLIWVSITDSRYDVTRKVLSGEAINLNRPSPVQYAPVLSCSQRSTCDPGDDCTGNACQ